MTDKDELQETGAARQQEELANAESTMQKNLAGGNIDKRGVLPGELQKDVGDELTSPHFKQIMDEALQGEGGIADATIERNSLMHIDPSQEV